MHPSEWAISEFSADRNRILDLSNENTEKGSYGKGVCLALEIKKAEHNE